MPTASPVVLYVEDEESDRFFMETAFRKMGLDGQLLTVNDGQAALDYLSGTGLYADREHYPLPEVVLLDLHLPEVHGFAVLQWIRAHPCYNRLPVVIFSSSVRDEDASQARGLGANQFVDKPNAPAGFRSVGRMLAERWLGSGPVSAEP